MVFIEVQPEALKRTVAVLEDRIKVSKAVPEGRQLSNAEIKALKTLEEERDATAALLAEAEMEEEDEKRVKANRDPAEGGIGPLATSATSASPVSSAPYPLHSTGKVAATAAMKIVAPCT